MQKINKRKAFSLIELSVTILIIGLLIAGVAGGKKLINVANLSQARSLTASSPVAGIEDLSFWFESTSKKSFITSEGIDGELVSQWNDINPQLVKKKNIVDLTSGTPNDRPTYVEDAANGLPALYFKAADQGLGRINTFGHEIASSDEITTFFVYKKLSPSQQSAIINWAAPANTINLHAPWSDNNMHWDFGVGGGRTTQTVPSSFLDNWQILSTIRQTNGVRDITVNNTPLITSASLNFLIPTQSSATLYIGGNSINSIKGYIAEVIIYSRALSIHERLEITKYLSKKWKIKID